MKRLNHILLSTVVAFTLGVGMQGCGGSSDSTIEQPNQTLASSVGVSSDSSTYIKKKETHLSTEPSNFRKYALVASGKINVRNTLTTDGPLADVHANGPIVAKTRSLNISGKITSKNKLTDAITRSFNYKSNIANSDMVTIRALKVSEFLNLNNITEYYNLSKDGKITKISDQKSEELTSIDGVDIEFKNGTWNINGNDISIKDNLKIEGDLNINSNYTFVSGALMVAGDLNSTGELNINVGNPFDSALVVNKSITVDKLTTIGRVHSSGDFTAKGKVNIIGNAEIDGNVDLYDDAKINMLDNVYKAALADAQQESEKNDVNLTLVHSQLFSDVKGNNSVVLFTFVEGNYLMDEKTLLSFIESGDVKDFKFRSYIYGASINYTSQLVKNDVLSSYYKNLLDIKKLLEKKYGEVRVVKYIDIAPSNLYCSFKDSNGNDVGTYLVSSLSSFDATKLVELSDEERDKTIEILDNPEKAIEDFETSTNSNDGNISEKINILDTDLNSTVKSEYESEQNEISTSINSIDKQELKKENSKYRVNEWVEYQELGSETKVVDIEEVVFEKSNSNSNQRGWWKKFKRKVKHLFRRITLTDCRKKIRHGEIDNVNTNTNILGRNTGDRWGTEVSLANDAFGYCTPTAAAMVMQYNAHVRKGKNSLYTTTNSSENVSFNNYRSAYNSYVLDWVNKLHTKKETSYWNIFWRLPYRIYKEHRRLNMHGWAYTYYTSFWNRSWQHYLVKYYISKNNPLIITTAKGTHITGEKKLAEDHSMPVIGWKTESYSGWCAKRIWPKKKWILVDTEYGHKGYMRFDSRSDYFKFGTMTYIRSY
jgi:cytoskeletal protein CcmA (bactofilin family)